MAGAIHDTPLLRIGLLAQERLLCQGVHKFRLSSRPSRWRVGALYSFREASLGLPTGLFRNESACRMLAEECRRSLSAGFIATCFGF